MSYVFTPGSGGTAASETISSQQYPNIKLTLGGAGTNDGPLSSSNPMPIGNIPGGTVGVLSALTNGSIVVTAGTLTVMPNIPGGTVGVLSSLTNGSIVVTASTVSAMPNIPGGTIGLLSSLTNGSIVVTAGTVRANALPTQNVLTYGTTFAATAAAYGTLVAAPGAATAIWVNDLSIVNSNAGTITCLVGFGTALNGTSVLAKGNFSPQTGIQKSYPKAVNAGMTNTDLVCYVGAAATIDVNVSYVVSA